MIDCIGQAAVAGVNSERAATLALTELYHNWFTGLILATSLHEGPDAAGAMVFQVYRRHHENRFLSSFDKLGLTGLPHAVACARYHYLSNRIGGVCVEYMEESEQKAWVRFAYPRWVYEGTALCAMPVSVSRGMLEGWYAQNAVSLGNPYLAFVCTSEDMGDGYGLAGYFEERSTVVPDDQRLTFAYDELPPPFDAGKAPQLDEALWTEARLIRARLNYAVEPIRLALQAMLDLFGDSRAEEIASRAARIVGLQGHSAAVAACFAQAAPGARGYAQLHAALAHAHGEQCVIHEEKTRVVIGQSGWRFARGLESVPAFFGRCWGNLWQGLAISHDRAIRLHLEQAPVREDSAYQWVIRSA
jgi:hypothetical protein